MPERSDPVISLPALCSAGHCLPQPPPQVFGGHRVSCALASLPGHVVSPCIVVSPPWADDE